MNSASVISVVGPTGTGKSALALSLAEILDGEIVNADSMQFYRGMDIGTAKVSVAERRGIAHHLLDILDVTEEASVSDFQRQARQAIAEIQGRGKRAILVGGSGLYVRAVLDVLEFPGTDPRIRQRLEVEAEAHGMAELRARLQRVDPASAERVADDRRVIRALEVHEVTGKPFSSFMPVREYIQPTVQIGLDVPRPILHERLSTRVNQMVDQGLADEVERLDQRGLRTGKTAGRALGYAQFLRVLDGETTVAAAAEETIIATRQFARRQSTWFRADPRIRWLDPREDDVVDQAAALCL